MNWKKFQLDESVYSQDSLLLTTVDLGDTFVSTISHKDGQLCVELKCIDGSELSEELENVFLQRLAHNEIRVRLQKAFAPIENAIVEKAFSRR